MKHNFYLFLFAIFFAVQVNSFAKEKKEDPVAEGPKNGALVIAGGGIKSKEIVLRFLELAGGKDAPIVFFPTLVKENEGLENKAKILRNHGATNVTVLYTTDREKANSEEFVASLKNATGVWFGGGRQWRFVENYKGTKVEKLVRELLDRGGVVGGSSAGASIQGDFLVRGDTKGSGEIMGDHQVGFGYLKNVAIDQHVLVRNRQFEMLNLLDKHPEYLGIGIDENTAIVVQEDQFEVIGKSYVL
ncbi:cyanophycinase, partial [Xanthovirga aplysinae]|uniref:cyanophycinase n=1 Tax=Xanthovirga aplysinae TaxID=2529853 RepID=UPI0012BBDC5F